MGIVDEAIEHGVGISGISNEQMPLVHWELAGDDGGAMTVAIFEDFQEVVTGTGVERLESPIIEDQQIDTAKAAQQAWMAAVAAGERQIVEQSRDALIEHGAIVATGLVAERRGEPTLANAGRAADQEIDVVVDPAALDKLSEQRAVETARGAVVDVLDARLLAQLGVAQASGEPVCRAAARLHVRAAAQAIRCDRGLRPHRWLRCRRRPWPCRGGRGR